MASIITRIDRPSRVRLLWERLQDLVFPRPCVFCHLPRKGGGPCLCGPCHDSLHWIERPFCGRCGIPAEIDYDLPQNNFECARCRTQPPVFDRARSVGLYESALKELIAFYKYRKQTGALKEIRSLLECYFLAADETYDGLTVVPVPLHVSKLRERQFDQACLLAREVARLLTLRCDPGLLKRIRPTPTQTRMTRSERIENVRGAFAVQKPEAVQGSALLIVDDVMTTGATLNEVARVLKRAGAARVEALTLARAA